MLSLGVIYVALTNRLTRLETRVDAHEKKHDTWEDTIQRIYAELKELTRLINDKNKPNDTHR
jgi:chaperonin cofactor prefoldin